MQYGGIIRSITRTTIGIISGLILVYGLTLSFILIVSGIFDIDSIQGIALQVLSLGSLWLFIHNKKNSKNYIPMLIGFNIGTFIGMSFIAIGVWHGIYPSATGQSLAQIGVNANNIGIIQLVASSLPWLIAVFLAMLYAYIFIKIWKKEW